MKKAAVRTLVVLLICVAASFAVWGAVKAGAASAVISVAGPGMGEARGALPPDAAAATGSNASGFTPRGRPGRGQLPEGATPPTGAPTGEGGFEGGHNNGISIGANTLRTLGENLAKVAAIILIVGVIRWVLTKVARTKKKAVASAA